MAVGCHDLSACTGFDTSVIYIYICALGHISTDVELEVHIGVIIFDHQANYGTRKTNRSDSHPFESKFLRFGVLTQKLWFGCFCSYTTPPKTKMTMENQPFEDVCPLKNGDFPIPAGPPSHTYFKLLK